MGVDRLLDLQEEIKKSHIMVLWFAAPAYPSFILADIAISPDWIGLCMALRLMYGLYALAGAIFYKKVHARHHTKLLMLSAGLIGLFDAIIAIAQRQPIHMLAFLIVVLVVGGMLSLRVKHALGLNAVFWVLNYLIPGGLMLAWGVQPGVTITALVAGTVASALSALISSRTFSIKKTQLEIAEQLKQKTQQLESIVERSEAQLKSALSVIVDLASVAQELSDIMQLVQNEAAQLSSSAEQMGAGISETIRGNEEVSESILRINQMLAASNQAIDDFASWEQGESLSKRQMLLDATGNLAQAISEIGSLSGVVADIARKTHILALNAGIEAAKTGGAGGFGVISARMRELSEDVRTRAGEIKELVDVAVNGAERLSVLMTDYVERSFKAGARFQEVREGISEIADASTRIKSKAQDITKASEQQASAVNQLVASANRLAELIQQLEQIARRVAKAEESLQKSM